MEEPEWYEKLLDNDVFIERQAGLLFSTEFSYAPRSRGLRGLTFDEPKTIQFCIERYFRTLDQYYDLYSFGAPTKFILRHNLRDAFSEAGIRTAHYLDSIMYRFVELTTEKQKSLHEAVVKVCEKVKKVVEYKNTRNFDLFTYRMEQKLQAEFKQNLRDELFFLFVDEPNYEDSFFEMENGKELQLRRFYFHTEVTRIVRELIFTAFIKNDQFATKLNPHHEPELQLRTQNLKNKMWVEGHSLMNENQRNIVAFNEVMENNKARFQNFLAKNKNLDLPEVEERLQKQLEFTVGEIKSLCDTFAVNNRERLKRKYIKSCSNSLDMAMGDTYDPEKIGQDMDVEAAAQPTPSILAFCKAFFQRHVKVISRRLWNPFLSKKNS